MLHAATMPGIIAAASAVAARSFEPPSGGAVAAAMRLS
jgi:hypothetical protein